jgi:16S rRNA (uracil1498-N3)-methyltransferase
LARVFLSEADVTGTSVTVRGDDAHHLTAVLRLGPGDRFEAITPDCKAHETVISAASRREVRGEIVASREVEREAGLSLTLYQAIPRGKRFPFILQKCTELGVARFVPMTTSRTVVEVEEGDAESHVERWTRITREACRQCGRVSPPQVLAPLVWKDALAHWQASGTPGLLFHERLAERCMRGGAPALREVLSQFAGADALAIFIGPEGGFSADEADEGMAAGLVATPLGARILRAETAAIVAAALCLYEAGDL